MSEEKTEEPTDKRLRDSREEGEVAHSTDLVGAVVLCATFGFLAALRNPLVAALRALDRDAFAFIATDRSMTSLSTALHNIELDALRLIAPFASISVIAAVIASLLQVGFTISFHPVTPKLESVSPDKGFKRIFSVKSLVDLARTLVKAVVIGLTMYQSIVMLMPFIAESVAQPIGAIIAVSWTALVRVTGFAVLAFLLIGATDWQFQRWNFLREHRMTKDEVKREQKDTDGNPEIKRKRKQLAKEIAFSTRSPKTVKRANVLVVNPTHFAVAIRYEPTEHALPIIIAKGADQSAIELRRAAHVHGIPIVGNPPVARALFRTDVDCPIPESLFEPVATILRWVEEIGARKRAQASYPA